MSLIIDRNAALYFGIFLELNILYKTYYKIKYKTITNNIFIIQDNESIVCGFYCITFIEHMPARKTLLDYTNLFSQNDF